MPAFICCKCGCVDNTAMKNTYWITRTGLARFKDSYYDTHPVCSECYKLENENGEIEGTGVWHGRFEKKHWSDYGTREELLSEGRSGLINVEEYFAEFTNNKEDN